ncbi:hypothetical protein JW859_03435 [bacterium]|nr:hypothetical protein [bacterium]
MRAVVLRGILIVVALLAFGTGLSSTSASFAAPGPAAVGADTGQAAAEYAAAQDAQTVYVYVTKTGKKYHRGDCRYLKKSKIKMTLEAAKQAGYTPCKVCKPPR